MTQESRWVSNDTLNVPKPSEPNGCRRLHLRMGVSVLGFFTFGRRAVVMGVRYAEMQYL